MNQTPLDWSQVDQIVENALREDVGKGDITTNLLFSEGVRCKAVILAKEEGVLAGLLIAERVFRKLDKNIILEEKKKDGDKIEPNQILAEISGSQRAILTGERLALNFLQRLSGIATLTTKFVKAVEGLSAKILDTRKTVPGLRILDKYAVSLGGAANHRFGLYDGVLIKDNHIKFAGSISRAVRLIREGAERGTKIEVETSTLNEVKEALEAGADIIMLDNMTVETIRKAVELINGRAIIEASGGVTLENIRRIAEAGVNFISVGSLTHSPRALDIALYMV
jgi:nicotinate-nucleotide pyrophosphorylase (carboxylating)